MALFHELRRKNQLLSASDTEKEALRALVKKYSPDFIEKGELEIKNSIEKERVCVFELTPKRITGKSSKDK